MKVNAEWTKKELTLRLGPIELASAVIEQWIKDGKPECDRDMIQAWYEIIRVYNKNKPETSNIGTNPKEEE